MKLLNSLAYLLFFNMGIAQLNYSEQYKFYENQLIKIGENEENIYFVTYKSITQFAEQLTYIKVSMSDGTPTFYKKDKLKINGVLMQLDQSVIVEDEIFELYCGHKMAPVIGFSTAFLAKRSVKDFELIGDMKKISVHSPYKGSVDMYVDDEGLFLRSIGTHKKGVPQYVKRFDLDLNELWSKDISNFYPESGDEVLKRTIFDKDQHALILQLNLAKCEDCGVFQRKKKVSSSVLGLSVFTKEGYQFSYIPELPGEFVFSSSHYFFNEAETEVVGIFEIHTKGENNYKKVSGSGYLFCKWEGETGELISSKMKRYDYDDIVNEEAAFYLSKMGLKSADYSGTYPKLKSYCSRYHLKNGNFITYYQNIAGIASDVNSDEAYNEAMNGCELIICLSPDGEIQWSKFIYSQGNHKNFGMTLTDDDRLIYITHGMAANYPSGEFEFNTREGINDKFVYNFIDLTNGETIARKTFEEKAITSEHTRVLTSYNQKAQKYSFGLQSNSGVGLGRKAAVTVLSISQN